MPHIKVKPIDEKQLKIIDQLCSLVTFRADAFNGNDHLLGISYQGEDFLLQLKREAGTDMLKYDKVTRPLKVDLIKEALAFLAEELDLEIESSNIAHSAHRPPLSSKYFKKIKDFESIKFPFEKMAVEIGFGSGRHLLYQAKQHPDKLYVGIEIHTPSAQQVLKQIELQGLNNIWVVNYDARLFLEMLPSNSCEQIFVHFPVPWDKKPHRRVISSSFTDESLRVLAPGGRLELRTDSEKYFWYSMETFFALPKAEVTIEKNRDLAVTSKYEARWKRQEKSIYEVHVVSWEESAEKSLDIDFSFEEVGYFPGLETKLPAEPVIMDGYFVHFERVYRIDSEALLVKIAFGSFDRPEHKYILINGNLCSYYASTPVKTAVNYQAHQKIVEFLYA
ncbi:MAG: tRNA (guanosine(46)-N7)-methyltransferase TrmB [Campylobacterota bacterium]|nr:tRNA (guanosine(46)-N7)-methyltransferase TrmB [Campylobacterota bacterium]